MRSSHSLLLLLLAPLLLSTSYETSGGGGGAATDLSCVACVDDAELASNYSGVGACGAGNYAQTLNDNAAPTCDDIDLGTDTVGSYVETSTGGDGITATCASEGCDLTVEFDIAETSGTNPTWATDTCAFTGAGAGGILCEGTGGNAFETEILITNPTTDRTITFPNEDGTVCTTGSVCSGYMATGADHGSLGGLTDDDHTQYTLKAGRATTTNDTTLSTAGTGTLYGSGTTANDLNLRSNSADTTTGTVHIRGATGQIHNLADIGDDMPDATTNTLNIIDVAPTVDITGATGVINGYLFQPTMTTTGSASKIRALYFNPTLTFGTGASVPQLQVIVATGTTTVSAASVFPTVTLFSSSLALDSTVADFPGASGPVIFQDTTTMRYSVASGTGTASGYHSFQSNPTLAAQANGGTQTVTSLWHYRAQLTLSTAVAGAISTVGTRYGFKMEDATLGGGGTETLTNQIAIDIPSLVAGTSNAGIRNASSTHFTASNSTSLGATFTLDPANKTYLRIASSGASSPVCSGTTCISDGAYDGQVLFIRSVEAGADTITIDCVGANVVLVGSDVPVCTDYIMTSEDTLTVIWDATDLTWYELARSVN